MGQTRYPFIIQAGKVSKKDDDSVTKILGRVMKKSGESDKAVEKVLSEYRDNAKVGRDYKAARDYIWKLTKEILSKWYVILAISLGSGATFWDSIKSVIISQLD